MRKVDSLKYLASLLMIHRDVGNKDEDDKHPARAVLKVSEYNIHSPPESQCSEPTQRPDPTHFDTRFNTLPDP